MATAIPALAAAASATPTQCDPFYGCNPPTTEPGTLPAACTIQGQTVVNGGETLNAHVTNLDPGAGIQITVKGIQSGSGTADANGVADVAFTVPAAIGEGQHAVFAVGAGVSASCGSLTGAAVLDDTIDNPDDNAGNGGSRGVGSGSLARTGIEIALLLAIAIVLLLAGQRLVAHAKRVKRRRSRSRNQVPELRDHVTAAGDR